VAADVFSALADAHVNVDMIIQNVGEQGYSDISCTVPIDDLPSAREALDRVVAELGAKGYTADDTMAKMSLIGAGMRTHPGVAALMFRTLADRGINLEMISTSPIKISCVISKDRVEEAVRALHDAFGLESTAVNHERADRGVWHD
jgi:aspartate kinase